MGTALGLVLGVLWQLLLRSDVVDRLTLISVVTLLVGFLFPLIDQVDYQPAAVHAALALVAGVVLTEQGHRVRDLRSARAKRV